MQNRGMIYGYARVSTDAQGLASHLTPHEQREAAGQLQEGDTQRSIARSYNVHQSMIARL